MEGCPIHTPVPECMALYREGRLKEAGALLFRNNPLSAVTSLVCDWQKFCYGHCVLNVKKQAVRESRCCRQFASVFHKSVTFA